MTEHNNPADYPLGTILRDPGSGRLAVRFQQDDSTGKGMHAWYMPAPDSADARILHHVEVYGWELVELPPGVAEVVRAVLERQAAEVTRLTRERDEAQGALMAVNDTLGLPAEALDDPARIGRALREALASRPAVPADAKPRPAMVRAIADQLGRIAASQDMPYRQEIQDAADALARRHGAPGSPWDSWSAPVSGSDTTEDGGQAWHVGDDPSADRALLLDAAEYVINGRHASVSAMQRNIRVGFAKASQLMDLLETWGIVGPAEGSMARKVLVPREHLHDVVEAIREGEQ